MLNTVKEIIYTVGDTTGSFAKTLGLNTADIAKTVGIGTVKVAKDIGPKRALIGAAILAGVIGGSIVLVRYLRRREVERLEKESMELSDEAMQDRKLARAESRAVNAARANMR